MQGPAPYSGCVSTVPGRYIASPGASPVPVTLILQNRTLFVEGQGVRRAAPLATARIDQTSRPGQSLVHFPDGATCEVADTGALLRLLASAPPSQWDAHIPRALWIILATIALMAIALYVYGIPVLARLAAGAVPASVTAPISDSVLASLDAGTLEPTTLSPARQQALRDAFARLIAAEGDAAAYRLQFRKGGAIGPNALALPSGVIVVTDELVQLAGDDREILGVLGHEAGHVAERHGVRLVFQESALGMLLAWVAGDISTVAAAAPATLMQAKYSRDFERDADRYAAALLRRRGIRPAALADLLGRIDEAGARGDAPEGGGRLLDYASSHPATAERLEYLRSQ